MRDLECVHVIAAHRVCASIRVVMDLGFVLVMAVARATMCVCVCVCGGYSLLAVAVGFVVVTMHALANVAVVDQRRCVLVCDGRSVSGCVCVTVADQTAHVLVRV